MTVCITGMHRSGTSMVARVLAACGLWLGPEDRLMLAKPDNPDGFFENRDLVQFNDQMLERLGGGWDAPPDLPRDWEDSELVRELAPPARELLGRVAAGAAGKPAWGWKDPRICLTLPFWQRLVPPLKVVVCVRNPVAVARSLRERGNYSLYFGMRLWAAYNRQLMQRIVPGAYLVTHYDAWFVDPPAELRRVLDFLDWRVADAELEAAVGFVKPDYRHHGAQSLEWLMTLGGRGATALYDSMRALAGPVYQASIEGRVAAQVRELEGSDEGAEAAEADWLRQELLFQRQRNAELVAAREAARSRRGFYRLGDAIDFRKGGNAPLYLTEGWANPEDGGTWSVAERPGLDLRLTEPVAGDLTLRARLRPMLSPGQERTSVQVIANGAPVGEWSFDGAGMVEVAAIIPAGRMRAQSDLMLEFHIREPRSPKEMGLSDDARKLGLFLQELRLNL